MPHVIVEYSANLDEAIDVGGLCETLRKAAAAIDEIAMPGVRVRAYRADHHAIADGADGHGFVDISVRLRGGRPDAVKDRVAKQLFADAREFIDPYMSGNSLALSLEVRDIDPELSPKIGTIRDHLKDNQ
ncbi:MAG: 5-carboxymethyl-2-hydroxymuconate isomerase [Boseongicola sp.]|nr:5-carboxymethyl-2-hydroxymuconate isomerase [Boseongicola sp.]MYH57480.1 5-carboxymethyl-2-hydroxymuconate Delta-isomerase [Boseongicola sp. SB0675_bin_26]